MGITLNLLFYIINNIKKIGEILGGLNYGFGR